MAKKSRQITSVRRTVPRIFKEESGRQRLCTIGVCNDLSNSKLQCAHLAAGILPSDGQAQPAQLMLEMQLMLLVANVRLAMFAQMQVIPHTAGADLLLAPSLELQ